MRHQEHGSGMGLRHEAQPTRCRQIKTVHEPQNKGGCSRFDRFFHRPQRLRWVSRLDAHHRGWIETEPCKTTPVQGSDFMDNRT
jgi:hypothetical protein